MLPVPIDMGQHAEPDRLEYQLAGATDIYVGRNQPAGQRVGGIAVHGKGQGQAIAHQIPGQPHIPGVGRVFNATWARVIRSW